MENMIYTALRVINLLNFLVFCDLGGIRHCSVAVPGLFPFVHFFVLSVSLLVTGQRVKMKISLYAFIDSDTLEWIDFQ